MRSWQHLTAIRATAARKQQDLITRGTPRVKVETSTSLTISYKLIFTREFNEAMGTDQSVYYYHRVRGIVVLALDNDIPALTIRRVAVGDLDRREIRAEVP